MIYIIIFILAIVSAFGMLSYQAWEIRNGKKVFIRENLILSQTKSFKNIERSILTFLKYFIQKTLLLLMKLWFLIVIKIKKLWVEKKPMIHSLLKRKNKDPKSPQNPSFVSKALTESKYKIRRMKEKLHEKHEVEL